MQEGSIIVFGAVNARGFYLCLWCSEYKRVLSLSLEQ